MTLFKRYKNLIYCLIIIILLLSCASSNPKKYNPDTITPQEEIRMGANYKKYLYKEYPLVEDKKIQNSIQAIGKEIVTKAGLEGKPYKYKFEVIKTESPVTFHLPGETIYMSDKFLSLLKTDSEKKALLIHEVAHLSLRHTTLRMVAKYNEAANQSMIGGFFKGLGAVFLGSVVGFAGHQAGKAACKSASCRRKANKTSSKAAGATTKAALSPTNIDDFHVIDKISFLSNTYIEEKEAQEKALLIIQKLGLKPEFYNQTIQKIEKLYTEKIVLDQHRAHPKVSEALSPK